MVDPRTAVAFRRLRLAQGQGVAKGVPLEGRQKAVPPKASRVAWLAFEYDDAWLAKRVMALFVCSAPQKEGVGHPSRSMRYGPKANPRASRPPWQKDSSQPCPAPLPSTSLHRPDGIVAGDGKHPAGTRRRSLDFPSPSNRRRRTGRREHEYPDRIKRGTSSLGLWDEDVCVSGGHPRCGVDTGPHTLDVLRRARTRIPP